MCSFFSLLYCGYCLINTIDGVLLNVLHGQWWILLMVHILMNKLTIRPKWHRNNESFCRFLPRFLPFFFHWPGKNSFCHGKNPTLYGIEFQTIGPATEKARQPSVLRWWRGTTSWWRCADRSRWRPAMSQTATQYAEAHEQWMILQRSIIFHCICAKNI